MKVIVTGDIGIGKTTLCERVQHMARVKGWSCGGLITRKIEREGEILGIRAVDLSDHKDALLASVKKDFGGPTTGRYHFDPKGIRFGNRAIQKGISSDLLIVDEVGALEADGEGFTKGLKKLESKRVTNAIIVVRKDMLPEVTPLLKDVTHVEVTEENRNDLPQKLLDSLDAPKPKTRKRGTSSKRDS